MPKKKHSPLCVCVTRYRNQPGFSGPFEPGLTIQIGLPVCRDCGGIGHQPDDNRFYALVAEISSLSDIFYPSNSALERAPFIDHPSGVRLRLLRKIEALILDLRRKFSGVSDSLAEQVADGLLYSPIDVLIRMRAVALEELADDKGRDRRLRLKFNTHAQFGRHRLAERLLLEAYARARSNKRRAEIAGYLGDLYSRFWLRFELAEQRYQEALRLDPRSVQAQLDLGVFYTIMIAHFPAEIHRLSQQAIFYLEIAAPKARTARALLAGFGGGQATVVRIDPVGSAGQPGTGAAISGQSIAELDRPAKPRVKQTYKQ